MFDKELKKFDEKQALLNMNLAAQDNMIEALTKANADYAPTRRAVMECEAKRRTRTEEIIASYEAVQNINTSAEKGITFYEQFLQTLSSLESRVKSVCEIQATERAKNAAKSNLSPSHNPLSSMSAMSTSLPDPRIMPAPVPSSTPRLRDYLPYMANKTMMQPLPQPQPGPVSQYMNHVPVTPPPNHHPQQVATSQPHYQPMQNHNGNHNNYAPSYPQPPPVSQPHVPHANMYQQQPQQPYALPPEAYAPQSAYHQVQPQHGGYTGQEQGYPQQQAYPQPPPPQPHPQYPQQHHMPHPSPQPQAAAYWPQGNGYQTPVPRPSADLLTDTVLEASDPNPILVPTPVAKES